MKCVFFNRTMARTWQVQLCETTVARRSRVILGSHSNRPSILVVASSNANFVGGILFYEPRCADLGADIVFCGPPCTDFLPHMEPHVQISWQPQRFVNRCRGRHSLHVRISWQAQQFLCPPCADFVAKATLFDWPAVFSLHLHL